MRRRVRARSVALYLTGMTVVAVVGALVVGNALRPSTLDGVLDHTAAEQQRTAQAAMGAVLGAEAFRSGLTDEQRAVLEPVITTAMVDNDLLWLSVVDINGDVMLSSDDATSRAHRPGLVPEIEVASAYLDTLRGVEALFLDLPMTDDRGDTVGLIQVATPPSTLYADVNASLARARWLTVAFAFAGQVLLLPLLVAGERRLRRQRDELRASAHTREFLSTHDPLTELPTRTHFERMLADAVRSHVNGVLGIVLIDINGFRAVNDTLGHFAGDTVLRGLAHQLRGAVRPGDVIARFGGDEFVLMLRAPDERGVEAATRRAMLAAQEAVEVDATALVVQVTAGIAIHPEDGNTPSELLRRVDLALNAAKRRHRGSCRYDTSMDEHTADQRTVLTQLRPGLRDDQFWVAYQPIVAAQTGLPVGLEALLRWDHPEHGPIRPDRFIGLAEQSGVIHELTDFVLRRGLRDMATSGLVDEGLYLSVNISARDLIGRDLARTIHELLHELDLPPWALQLEVTETIAMVDPERAIEGIEAIRELGVPIAIDDYGTGHASLAYLQRLPVQCLKIDRSFVSNLTERTADHAIVRSTIELAHNLGFLAVAEGVEDEHTLDRLRDLGCDLIQGFHLGRPAALADALDAISQLRRTAAFSGIQPG